MKSNEKYNLHLLLENANIFQVDLPRVKKVFDKLFFAYSSRDKHIFK
jgi:hypothetical protein